VKELRAKEDTVCDHWPGLDLLLLRSSTKFPLRDLICCASVRSDVPHARSTAGVVSPHQNNSFQAVNGVLQMIMQTHVFLK